jgi:hypothetical protein
MSTSKTTGSFNLDFSSPREVERRRKKLAALICVDPSKVCDWMVDDFTRTLTAWRDMAMGAVR